jgi:hypothetical protein
MTWSSARSIKGAGTLLGSYTEYCGAPEPSYKQLCVREQLSRSSSSDSAVPVLPLKLLKSWSTQSWQACPARRGLGLEALDLPLPDCLKTFNWGAGYYVCEPLSGMTRRQDFGPLLAPVLRGGRVC